MRSVWNAVLRFGQVVVPVALVPAKRDGDVALKTIHLPCGNPIQEAVSCPLCGSVDPSELGKGWEVAPGQHVIVGKDELAALVPDAGRDLEVLAYVDAAAIAPAYVGLTYYLRPAQELAGKRAYVLVAQTLATEGVAIVARYVSRRRERLCAIRAIDGDGLLGLQTLALAEDVIDPSPIHESVAAVAVSDGELALARQLVGRYVRAFDPGALLAGRQRERIRQLLEGKLAADEITTATSAPVEGAELSQPPVDLEAALRASLKQAPKTRRRRAAAARA